MFLAVDEIDVNNLTVSDIQDDHEVEMTRLVDGKRKLPKFYGSQDIPMALMDQVIDLKEEILPQSRGELFQVILAMGVRD